MGRPHGVYGNGCTVKARRRGSPLDGRISREQASSGLRLLMINIDHFERFRAGGIRLCGRNLQSDLGLRFIDTPGVELERCGFRQHMGQRVSNLQEG
jgi:hypothetical protein